MAQLREVSARASAPQLNQRLSPMRTFVTVWLGQIVSVLGSYITDFALGVWVLQTTGSITNFALALVFMHLPSLIIAPFAGALVDRWNRRWAMLLSDVVKCSTALTMMFLVSSDSLQVWHIYVGVAVGSACVAFQWPAYISAITQLVPKQHLSRANGMVQISKALARFVGLAVAGGLMEAIQVRGVLLLDSFSYLFAIFMLLIVRFPATEVAQRSTNVASLKKLWQETTAGWQYIAKYPGLIRLFILSGLPYLTEGIVGVVFWPLVLSFASESGLSRVISVSGCGMLLGSAIIVRWGGFRPRVFGIIFSIFLQGICLCLGGFRPSIALASIGGFGYLFGQAVIVSSNHTIWQSKVPVNIQGRVFALQTLMEKSLLIVAQLSTGLLIDGFFEPLMAADGALADSVGRIIGVGEGRGIALVLILVGIMNVFAALIAYQIPRLRRVETDIPDAIIGMPS